MLPLDAQPDQSGQVSIVAHLPYAVGRSAGCTVHAVVHQRASGMEITNTAPARREPLSFGSSSNRFADEFPLSGLKRRRTCDLQHLLLAVTGCNKGVDRGGEIDPPVLYSMAAAVPLIPLPPWLLGLGRPLPSPFCEMFHLLPVVHK